MRPFLAFAIASSLASSAIAEEKPVEIPLKEIWAHSMPDTRDIHELEGKPEDENSFMAIIGRAIQARHGHKVGKAFAVEGSGLDALKAAFRIVTKQPKWSVKPLQENGEVSVAFYTHYSPYYVHLAKVTRTGKTVRIEYELLPHLTDDRTLHFAMIPLGRLPSGDYQVEIVAKAMDQKYIKQGFKEVEDEAKEKIVSSSFKFHVD